MTPLSAGRRKVEQDATLFAQSPAMAVLARAGLASRGVVYVLLAWLAIRVAYGNHQDQPSQQGALETIARQPLGHIPLAALAAGFAAYAVWQLTLAVFAGKAPAGSGSVAKRGKALATAVLYGFFCVTAVALVIGSGSSGSGSGNAQETGWTGRVMRQPFGRVMVAAAGLTVIGVGVFMAWRALSGAREVNFRFPNTAVGRATEIVGAIGLTARALIVGAAGAFVVDAAVTFDAQKARGLDGTLRSFATTPIGPPLLVLVAAGVFAFGVYSLAEARYAQL